MANPFATTPKATFSNPVSTEILKDKSVLLTGGASGLGAAATKVFASAGAFVTIVDIQEEAGKKLAEELKSQGHKALFVHTDVTDWNSQVTAFKAAITNSPHKSLDVVVPFAGILEPPMFHGASAPSLDKDPEAPSTKTIAVNLTGVYYSAYLALHYFQLPAGPDAPKYKKTLILIASMAGFIDFETSSTYNATKFGVRGLWRSLRATIAPEMGARANVICPWFIHTPLTKSIDEGVEAMGLRFAPMQPLVDGVIKCATDESIDGWFHLNF